MISFLTLLLGLAVGVRVQRVTKAVEWQRIVWLEGRHLPQAVSLSPKARRVTLVD